jgi:hypothetical protein
LDTVSEWKLVFEYCTLSYHIRSYGFRTHNWFFAGLRVCGFGRDLLK